MDEQTKKQINERYERELDKGERFWPDSIFKDVVMAVGIFILLILLASFVGIPFEPKADPSDTSYIPRPEWYFLFLFKFFIFSLFFFIIIIILFFLLFFLVLL